MKKNKQKMKVILLIVLIFLAIFFHFNSGYDSIEEKIIDDINIGVTDEETVADLFLVDEYSEDFYVCVGETTADKICVLSMQYESSGVMHGKEQVIQKDKLFDVPTRTLTINKQKIVYGFTDDIDSMSIEIDGRTVELFTFSYPGNTEEKTISFWYYIEK